MLKIIFIRHLKSCSTSVMINYCTRSSIKWNCNISHKQRPQNRWRKQLV